MSIFVDIYNQIRPILSNKGYTLPIDEDIIGEGSYGMCFFINNETCLKITTDVMEARAGMYLKGKKKRGVIKVYDSFRISTKFAKRHSEVHNRGSSYYALILGRGKLDERRTESALEVLNKYDLGYLNLDHLDEFRLDARALLHGKKQRRFRDARNLVHGMLSLAKCKMSYGDLHEGNVVVYNDSLNICDLGIDHCTHLKGRIPLIT